jgi:hypothetical protein
MLITYADAVVSTLNVIVWPRFTLMFVAKPWIVGSPMPSMSHSLGGLPGSAFSQTIGLEAGGVQVCPAAPLAPINKETVASIDSARANHLLPVNTGALSSLDKLYPLFPSLAKPAFCVRAFGRAGQCRPKAPGSDLLQLFVLINLAQRHATPTFTRLWMDCLRTFRAKRKGDTARQCRRAEPTAS